jgi:hypothetical protein
MAGLTCILKLGSKRHDLLLEQSEMSHTLVTKVLLGSPVTGSLLAQRV